MKFILDVNVLISALIKDSKTRKIILKSNLDFCFPEVSYKKLKKYENLILEKSRLEKQEYRKLLSKIFLKIKLIKNKEPKKHWKKAKMIMEHIDRENVTFMAACLTTREKTINCSDDKDFERQNSILVIKTNELAKKMKFS